MVLSKFSSVMPLAVVASIDCANALRYVRDTSGDLTFRALNNVQDGLATAKITTGEALTEGTKQPAHAESFMASLGGPATLAEYYAAAQDTEIKASAWNVELAALLSSLTADELIGLEPAGVAPLDYKLIEHRSFIPAAKADPFRSNQALADLIASFEAVGAV
jgi:hypothetical protein